MREVVEVVDGVHVATAARWSTTTTLVGGPGGPCLIVDPALTPTDLTGLAAWCAGRHVTLEAAFATHAHWDHVLWSTELPAVDRWATVGTVRRAEQDRAALLADASALGHDPDVVAVLRPLTSDHVPWSGGTARVLATDGHAPGHGSLLLEERAVLVAGDMLSDVEVPLLDTDAPDPVSRYHAALDVLAAVLGAVDVLVPGHGTVTDRAGARRRLDADRRYLDALAALSAATRRVADVEDERLRDRWVAGEHARQLARLRGGTPVS